MPDTDCFVCGTSLLQFDEAAANFHLNACLDGSNTAGGPADIVHGPSDPDSSGIVLLSRPSLLQCPVCEQDFPSDSVLQDHVEACLLASRGAGVNGAPQDRSQNPAGQILAGDVLQACPCCLLEWSAIDVPAQERDLHVADCLAQAQALREDDNESDEGTSAYHKGDMVENIKSNGFGKLRNAWAGQGEYTTVTSDLIPQLQIMLERSSNTRLAVLCNPKVQHIKSQFGDFGWGCGYKSACMVFSALRHVKQYRQLLLEQNKTATPPSDAKPLDPTPKGGKRKVEDDTYEPVMTIPTIRELQESTEAAWKAGFDPEGRRHFNGKLVGSRKWIGTSEVYTMFTWLGIRTTIIDFPKVEGSAGAHSVLAKWVFDYFKTPLNVSNDGKDSFGRLMGSRGTSVRVCEDRMPLYLQHQGHSRVIVGVEETKSAELNLLVFDCGKKVVPKLREAAASASNKRSKSTSGPSSSYSDASFTPKLLEPYRVNLKSLSKKDEYQILRVETHGGALSKEEKLARREITSLRVT